MERYQIQLRQKGGRNQSEFPIGRWFSSDSFPTFPKRGGERIVILGLGEDLQMTELRLERKEGTATYVWHGAPTKEGGLSLPQKKTRPSSWQAVRTRGGVSEGGRSWSLKMRRRTGELMSGPKPKSSKL